MAFAPGCQNAQLHSNKTDLMPLASFDFLPPKLLLTVVAVALGFEPEWGNKGPNNDSPYRGSIGAFPSTLELRKLKLWIKKKIDLMETHQFRKTSYISQKQVSKLYFGQSESKIAVETLLLHFRGTVCVDRVRDQDNYMISIIRQFLPKFTTILDFKQQRNKNEEERLPELWQILCMK